MTDPPDPPDRVVEIYFDRTHHVTLPIGTNGHPPKIFYRWKRDAERFQSLHGRERVTLVYREKDYVRGIVTVTAKEMRDYLGIKNGKNLNGSSRNGKH